MGFSAVISVVANSIVVFGDLYFSVNKERCHGFDVQQREDKKVQVPIWNNVLTFNTCKEDFSSLASFNVFFLHLRFPLIYSEPPSFLVDWGVHDNLVPLFYYLLRTFSNGK